MAATYVNPAVSLSNNSSFNHFGSIVSNGTNFAVSVGENYPDGPCNYNVFDSVTGYNQGYILVLITSGSYNRFGRCISVNNGHGSPWPPGRDSTSLAWCPSWARGVPATRQAQYARRTPLTGSRAFLFRWAIPPQVTMWPQNKTLYTWFTATLRLRTIPLMFRRSATGS